MHLFSLNQNFLPSKPTSFKLKLSFQKGRQATQETLLLLYDLRPSSSAQAKCHSTKVMGGEQKA